MKKKKIAPKEGWEVILETKRAKAATMILAPSDSTGGPDNRHPDSDQWLFVLSGSGEAIVEGEKSSLEKNMLLVVEANEAHEIKNTGNGDLVTLNIYA